MESILFTIDTTSEVIENQPEFIYIDKSRITGFSIFRIDIDIEPSFIYKFLSVNFKEEERLEKIKLFLRNVKVNYLLNKKPLDAPMVKFINFLEFLSINKFRIIIQSK